MTVTVPLIPPRSGDWNSGEMYDEDNTDAYIINDIGGDFHCYHTNGMTSILMDGWTFDAGGAGTSFPIASIADGADSGVDIEVTTTGSHNLGAGDVVSQTNLTDAAYVGVFVIKAIIAVDKYEVAAVYTATGTGTMDQAATLTCDVGSASRYHIQFHASATSAANNDSFDWQLYNGATIIVGSKVRRKFGTGGDFGSFSSGALTNVANGDKISFALANQSGSGHLTIRNCGLAITGF